MRFPGVRAKSGNWVEGMRGPRHRVATVVLWCVMAILASSCAVLGVSDEDEQSSDEMVFWTGFGPPDVNTVEQMVDAYNETDPDVRVKMVRVTGDETDVTKLMTAVRGGTGPDVYQLDRFTAAQRAEAGLLQDLTSYMEEDGGVDQYESQYLDFAWKEVEFDGKPWALPTDTDARALYYNKGMLEKAGVDPAELDASNGPISLDRVQELAFKVNKTDDSGAYTHVGFIPWFNQGWHYTWGFDFGGSFFDSSSCEVTPTDPGIEQAFQWLYDYAKAMDPKKAQSFLSTYAGCSGPLTCETIPPAQDPFINERAAMVVTGDWWIKVIDDYAPDMDYGITYIPTPEGREDEPSTWAGGWSVVIPEGAKNPDGAWEFMKWFAGEEGQRMYSEGSAHLPTLTSLQTDESLFAGQHALFADLVKIAQARPPLPVGALYWDELTAAQEAVLLNRDEPVDALAQVASRVQPQLDRFCPLE